MGSAPDILSYRRRMPSIHILTLDRTLSEDIYDRIHSDPRLEPYQIVRPQETHWKRIAEEIEAMAPDTIASRLLIIDVRKDFLPKLQRAYNKIVGYNRRDLNQLCNTLLICDGPLDLFKNDDGLNAFVPMLAERRQDYNPAAFFYDPLIHYEPEETEVGMDKTFVIPERLPKRFKDYFTQGEISMEYTRRYFRAKNESKQVKQQRLKLLAAMYQKNINKYFPNHKDQFAGWLTKNGIRLANERMNLYPLFFEDWVDDLMEKAAEAKKNSGRS